MLLLLLLLSILSLLSLFTSTSLTYTKLELIILSSNFSSSTIESLITLIIPKLSFNIFTKVLAINPNNDDAKFLKMECLENF